ncbi:hypothetical protein [Cytobacillus praedii]|uniref:hypothetical protein n=1 Tax=Cytobacillus praedii TaxID=1742358 RepID=UPI003AF93642
MKYEYNPILLKQWIRDNSNLRLTTALDNSNEKYRGELEVLKEGFEKAKSYDSDRFFNWTEKLSRRQKLLLPNVYKQELNSQVKDNLLKVIRDNAKNEKRLFRILVDSLYQTCDLDEMWKLVKYSFAIHQDTLKRRLSVEQASSWKDFLLSKDPVRHLATEAYGSEKGFLEELESYYLTENFPLYRLVLMEVFSIAIEDFFIKEKKTYKSYFNSATNEEQQKMAEGLIKNCKLNNVKDLGKLVYEKLKTYRRKPMLWKMVGEEEKKRFANWILRLEIKDFFGNINTNHERYQYWKKFIVNLEDVVIIDNRSTLIMYFPDVVVMEVLGTGAVYVYSTSVFNKNYQGKLDKMLKEREKYQDSYYEPKDVKRSELMDKYRTVTGGWLIHSGDWQFKFDNWLRSSLSWEVRESVLLQKEAERDEG